MADIKKEQPQEKEYVVSSTESLQDEKVKAALAEIPDPDAGKSEEERKALVSFV